MPQKLNKAGKMQDYIPKGNGDASGEYGTSNGTNKNFTTSDKKTSKANVITENKSVVVENKGKKLTPREKIKKAVETKDIDESNKLMDEATSELKFNSEEERDKFLDIVASYSDPQEMFDYLDKAEKKGKTKLSYVDDVLNKLPKDLDDDELNEAIQDELNDSVWYEDNNSENISQKKNDNLDYKNKTHKEFVDFIEYQTNIDLSKYRDTQFDNRNGFNIDTKNMPDSVFRQLKSFIIYHKNTFDADIESNGATRYYIRVKKVK